MAAQQRRRGATGEAEGVWSCTHCGRRLQVIVTSDAPARQAFVCVCGTEMEPGPGFVTDESVAETGHRAPQTLEAREVRETQVSPVAGIWACNRCGRRIQVMTAGRHDKLQPFTCVCGAQMEPGEEHAVDDSPHSGVVDD